MTTQQLIHHFLDYYRRHGHRPVPDTGLIPDDDSTLLTTSGMQPLMPWLSVGRHPAGDRLVGVQSCCRTVDFDEIGDSTHLTGFRMLGSWSLGSYGIERSLELYLDWIDSLGIDLGSLGVTVWGGDSEVGPDHEVERWWRDRGYHPSRSVEDNWWSVGDRGLCGTNTEIFVGGDPLSDPENRATGNHVMMRFAGGWLIDSGICPQRRAQVRAP